MFFKVYKPAIISGLLFGLSFPSYPYVHLEILAWVGLIPFLLDTKDEQELGLFFRKAYVMMLCLVFVSVWWISLSTVLGGVLTFIAQTFFMTIPLLIFYYLKQWLKWVYALLSLPFVWTAWEWLYLNMDISFGWLTLANSQSNMIWLVQYIDIFGAWGISFWLILFNVLVLIVLERHGHKIRSRPFITDFGKVFATMLLLPVAYSIFMFQNEPEPKENSTITVSIVQPNIDPFKKWETMTRLDILSRHMDLTDSALSVHKPDMILWPETAIPYFILFKGVKGYRNMLFQKIRDWQTPLLTGFSDAVYYPDSTKKQAGAKYDKRLRQYYDTFNSAMLMAPEFEWPQVYHKMKLVPFAERVPYMEHFSFLSFATIELAGISSWGRGQEMNLLSFTTKQQDTVKVCGLICYESIYPGFIAEFVAQGADFLTIITNDGWFSKSYGPYQHAAFARLRCIETRRSMARSANTGISFFIDRYGRTYGEIPWWQALTTTQPVQLSRELTFYVRHIDWFPKLCLAISVLIIVFAAGMGLKNRFTGERRQEKS
jgi:apolipoprotein N-acyltransferase